jgi:hypothetical protein
MGPRGNLIRYDARLQIPHSKYVKGRHRPIDALALAFVAVALSLPALIAATMLGSKLNLNWEGGDSLTIVASYDSLTIVAPYAFASSFLQ